MVITFSLRLPRDGASVGLVRHICRDALVGLGVASPCVSDVELALTEACTNVLDHAAGTAEDYEVTVEINETKCEIRVIDFGEGFAHAGFPSADLAPSAESGRGILLMKALVDNVKFLSRPEQGTVVHLEKVLDLEESSVLRRLVPSAN
jgi:serine/threonine-protein kinase RsbW